MNDEQITRVLVVWCPDWPVHAVGAGPDVPAAVLVGEGARATVLACSAAARAAGVRRGQRVRDAQRLCPELRAYPRDEPAEERVFEPVVQAVEDVAAGVEVVRPGLIALAAPGPARYHGGEARLALLVREAVADVGITEPAAETDAAAPPGDPLGCGVGIADGTFAASLAARLPVDEPLIVPPGGSAAFLAPYPLRVFDRPELSGILERLGIRTLGDLAALPVADVANRFGPVGVQAHRLARGLDPRPPAARRPGEDLSALHLFDPPAERDEQVLFAAKALADRWRADLAAAGVTCASVRIELATESGAQYARTWRNGDALGSALSAQALAQRVRWQLDGWRTRVSRAGAHSPREASIAVDVPGVSGVSGAGATRGSYKTSSVADVSGVSGAGARGSYEVPAAADVSEVSGAGARGPRGVSSAVDVSDVSGAGARGSYEVPAAADVSEVSGAGARRARGGSSAADVSGVRVRGSYGAFSAVDVFGGGVRESSGGSFADRAREADRFSSVAEVAADPLVSLRLVPGPLVVDTGSQQALWGRETVPDRVDRAAERVQAMLGHDGVTLLHLTGGRDPAARIARTLWGEKPPKGSAADPDAPWPGAVPAPAPSLLPEDQPPVLLLGSDGAHIEVSGRVRLSDRPAVLVLGGRPLPVTTWAGPWPYHEHPWRPAASRRRARLQLSTADGRAFLLALEHGAWRVEGVYR
ncbi:DNA polymerase Y family protein [Actinospica sp.]|uniref:DNA polymerase Y family protein n=1 Tax=Actinospica sp. TaxID=1872142 RepID=UPI002BBFE452|nr:DNA polymerase Y family protein [Actinospica sp.]HWG25277.1 DNA polymerase Y family protein [Actinospica sp.]